MTTRRRCSDVDTSREPVTKKRCLIGTRKDATHDKDADNTSTTKAAPTEGSRQASVAPGPETDPRRSDDMEEGQKESPEAPRTASSSSRESDEQETTVVAARPSSAPQNDLPRQKLMSLQARAPSANTKIMHTTLPKANGGLPSAISQNKNYQSPYPAEFSSKIASSTPQPKTAYRHHGNYHALDPPATHDPPQKLSDTLRPGFQLYARYHDVAAFIRTCSPHRTPDRSLVVLRFEAVPPY